MWHRSMFLGIAVAAVLVFSLAQAQEQGGQERPRRDRAGAGARAGEEGARRGGPDGAAFRERMMSNLKEQMGASEEEWKALQPKIEKTTAINRELRFGMYGGRGRPENPPGTPEAATKLADAQRELRTALENKSTPDEELTKKLADVRTTREKARVELKATQKEIKETVASKPRQEAVLVLNGILD